MLMCREHEEAPSAQRQPQPRATISLSPSLRGRDSQGPLLGVVKSSEDPQRVRVRSDRGKGRISESDDGQRDGSQSPFSSLSILSFLQSLIHSTKHILNAYWVPVMSSELRTE